MRKFSIVAALLVMATLVLYPAGRTTPYANRFVETPVALAAQDDTQQIEGLTAGIDFRTGVLLLEFTSAADVTTAAQAESAINTLATGDTIIAAAEIVSVTPMFHAASGDAHVTEKTALGLDHFFRVAVPTDTDLPALLAAYAIHPEIASADVDMIGHSLTVPNDPRYNDPGQFTTIQWNHQVMHSEAAWDVTTGDVSNPVVIGFVDTGIDFTHEDLMNQIWNNSGETGLDGNNQDKRTNSIDDDANGFVDDWRGWDFINDDNDPTELTAYHGSVVAGAAAEESNNALGAAGTCWQCKIMMLESGLTEGAVEYAVDNGADVINISTGNAKTVALHRAIQYAVSLGVPVIAAAGNVNETGQAVTYPAAYPETLAVASSWQNGERAGGDNPVIGSAWGSRADIAAPVETWTTKPYNLYQFSGGTSIASGMVSGLVGLLEAVHPELRTNNTRDSVNLVASALRGAVNSIVVNGTARYVGTGIADAEKLVTYRNIPYAQLDTSLDDLPITANTVLTIRGTAAGEHFLDYTVEYAAGIYPAPTSWSTIASSTTPVTNDSLATLYGASLTTNGPYSLRLTVHTREVVNPGQPNEQVYNDTSVDETHVIRGTLDYFPADGRFFHGATTGDLDEDGNPEVIAAAYDGLVHAWKSDGTDASGWPQETANQNFATPAVGDFNADGHLDVVIGSDDGKMYAFNHDGTPLSSAWPKTFGNDYVVMGSSPLLADIDSDGQLEAVVGIVYGPNTTFSGVAALNADGTYVNTNWDPYEFTGAIVGSPTAGDIDGDGKLEVVFATQNPQLFLLNGDGTEAVSPQTISGNPNGVALADLDNNGSEEVIITTQGTTDTVRVYKGDGSRYGGFPTINAAVSSGPSIGDIDNDGTRDIVYGTNDTTLHVLKLDGTEIDGWPVTLPARVMGESPALADVTNDGWTDLIFGIADAPHTIMIVGHDGQTITSWITAYHPYLRNANTPLIADLNGDGKIEVAAASEDAVYVQYLPDNINLQKMEWPMARFHPRATSQTEKHCTVINHNQCSTNQPLRCQNGSYVPKCQVCGCPTGTTCQSSGYCATPPPPHCKPNCQSE